MVLGKDECWAFRTPELTECPSTFYSSLSLNWVNDIPATLGKVTSSSFVLDTPRCDHELGICVAFARFAAF
jgi:hypothetical protein